MGAVAGEADGRWAGGMRICQCTQSGVRESDDGGRGVEAKKGVRRESFPATDVGYVSVVPNEVHVWRAGTHGNPTYASVHWSARWSSEIDFRNKPGIGFSSEACSERCAWLRI